jgi:hypothetical protein
MIQIIPHVLSKDIKPEIISNKINVQTVLCARSLRLLQGLMLNFTTFRNKLWEQTGRKRSDSHLCQVYNFKQMVCKLHNKTCAHANVNDIFLIQFYLPVNHTPFPKRHLPFKLKHVRMNLNVIIPCLMKEQSNWASKIFSNGCSFSELPALYKAMVLGNNNLSAALSHIKVAITVCYILL